jgi:hypothetical protein
MYALLTRAVLACTLFATPDHLPGRYTLDRTASDEPVAVVDAALRDVSRMRRGRMRSELLQQLTPAPVLEVRWDESTFSVLDGAGQELRAVAGAPAERITTPQGQQVMIEARIRGEALVLRITGDRGGREQEFSADASSLTITSRYTVAALEAPITLRTVYRRVAP